MVLLVGNCGGVFTDRSGKTFRIGASSQDISWWPKDPERPGPRSENFRRTKKRRRPRLRRRLHRAHEPRRHPRGNPRPQLAQLVQNCVTSFGDVFANDNDDQPASRTFWVLEGGNYGFASADGSRGWQADRRPGQDIKTATWRQQDPGVAPAGDVYGGGAPTGIVFYEDGALGEKWEGTLLSCDAALNTILGYKPEADGAGWKLDRFDFLTTNKEGKIIGTDFTGGDTTAKADDTKTLFRPSDIAVGPDGALYIADWFDARIGGHNDLDDSLAGTIYRVAPKGFRSVPPKFDLATVDGAIEALKSPAVNVRALGVERLRSIEQQDPRVTDPLFKNRERPPLEHRRLSLALLERANERRASPADEGAFWVHYFRGLGIRDARMITAATKLSVLTGLPFDANVPYIANGMSAIGAGLGGMNPATSSEPVSREKWEELRLYFFALHLPPGDATYLESWGMLCQGKETSVYEKLLLICTGTFGSNGRKLPELGSPDPLKWSNKFAALAWRLHPPQSVPAFKTRALAKSLPEKARKDALTAIGFNDTKEAAEAMLAVALATREGGAAVPAAQPSDGAAGTAAPHSIIHTTALWWLLNRKDNAWKDHGLAAALKKSGLYDPDTIQLTAVNVPEPPPSTIAIQDALNLTGDAKRGEIASQRCLMCHRLGQAGVDFGPDMTTWGRTQPTEVILRSLIEPSADIAHGFHGAQVETTDGTIIQGLVVTDGDPLIIQSMGGLTQTVPRARLKSKSPMTRSLMLSATQQGMTAQDVADVAAFLKRQTTVSDRPR